ncbi:MAG: hypothetical protein IKC31_06275 [Clostridia bacterium]|nr:hypothetical protein [Clostridia bacterium]
MAKIISIIMVVVLLSIPLAIVSRDIPPGQHFAVDWVAWVNNGVLPTIAALCGQEVGPPDVSDPSYSDNPFAYLGQLLGGYLTDVIWAITQLDIGNYVYYTDFHAEPYPIPGT